jgi:sugar phosphate isomerase/epimerase
MTRSFSDFGGSTFSFMWSEPALSAMQKLKALGLNDFDVIMVPGHLWHDELGAGDRAALARALRAEGMRLESLNLPALDVNLASCVREVRHYAVDVYAKAMQLCRDLGGRAVVVVPGRVSGLWPPAQRDSESWLAEALERLLETADALDLDLYIESHPQTPIPTVDRIERFLARIEHRRLKVAYDVSNAEFVSENQVDALRRLAPRLGQVHLSDGTRTRWRHDRVGLGTVDFRAILDVLDAIGFAGVRLLEIISPSALDDIAASKRALEALRGPAA